MFSADVNLMASEANYVSTFTWRIGTKITGASDFSNSFEFGLVWADGMKILIQKKQLVLDNYWKGILTENESTVVFVA